MNVFSNHVSGYFEGYFPDEFHEYKPKYIKVKFFEFIDIKTNQNETQKLENWFIISKSGKPEKSKPTIYPFSVIVKMKN